MTTLTTILGLLPMAFAQGEGSEMMAPMAVVMITVWWFPPLSRCSLRRCIIRSSTAYPSGLRTASAARGGKNGDPGDEEPEPPLELETKEEGRSCLKRGENRRSAILHAACKEFSEKGFAGAKIEEIARQVGIGKSTVYEYFPSKTDLLEQAADWMIGRVDVDVPQDHGKPGPL